MNLIKHTYKQYRRLLMLPVFLLITTLAISQEIIDEDFIDILTQNSQELLSEQDADFTTTNTPDKWND
jgi:hypothetical protein